MHPVGVHRMLGRVAFSSRDDQTLRPAQSAEGVAAATSGGRPDAGDGRHGESGQVNLHLTLLPGDRLWGAVGRVGDDDRRIFRGWLDLMYAIQQLRGSSAKDHGAP
jgi:hypothetical protein